MCIHTFNLVLFLQKMPHDPNLALEIDIAANWHTIPSGDLLANVTNDLAHFL